MGVKLGSLTLRNERRQRATESCVLRKIFAPKRDEVAGDSRRLHNEKLPNFYPSPYIIRMIKSRRMKWARSVACMR
jgi:hypothetical protein